MKISSAHSLPLPPATEPSGESTRPTRGLAQGTLRGADRVDLAPGAVDRARSDGPTAQERLSAHADRVHQRLGNLADTHGLDREQSSALAGAQAEFDGIMGRISNALENGGLAPATLAQGLTLAMQGLRADVRAAVNGPQPTILPEPPTASVVGTGESDGTAASEGLEKRLAHFEQRLSERIANLGQDAGIGERHEAALGAAQESFEALMDRIRNAFFEGDRPMGRIGKDVAFALGALRDDVHQILASAMKDDSEPRPRELSLYGPGLDLDVIAGNGAQVDRSA